MDEEDMLDNVHIVDIDEDEDTECEKEHEEVLHKNVNNVLKCINKMKVSMTGDRGDKSGIGGSSIILDNAAEVSIFNNKNLHLYVVFD